MGIITTHLCFDREAKEAFEGPKAERWFASASSMLLPPEKFLVSGEKDPNTTPGAYLLSIEWLNFS